MQLYEILEWEIPEYRHHFLLLESRDEKLAKMHGSMPFSMLRENFTGPEMCGVLSMIAGINPSGDPCTPHELIRRFDWKLIREDDLVFAQA